MADVACKCLFFLSVDFSPRIYAVPVATSPFRQHKEDGGALIKGTRRVRNFPALEHISRESLEMRTKPCSSISHLLAEASFRRRSRMFFPIFSLLLRRRGQDLTWTAKSGTYCISSSLLALTKGERELRNQGPAQKNYAFFCLFCLLLLLYV